MTRATERTGGEIHSFPPPSYCDSKLLVAKHGTGKANVA